MSSIGTKIKSLRGRITQRELVAKIKECGAPWISNVRLCRIERGHYLPTLAEATAIRLALGLSEDSELFKEEDLSESPANHGEEIANQVKKIYQELKVLEVLLGQV